MTCWLQLGLAVLVSGAAEAAEPLLSLDFDARASIERWTFGDGPEFPGATGGIAWNGQDGHDADGCLALQFSFEKGGNYVEASLDLAPDIDPRRVTLWLRKPGGHRVTFRVVDAAGQAFQKGVDYDYPGWQRVEVDLARWTSHWGGPADGKVRYPLRAFKILIPVARRAALQAEVKAASQPPHSIVPILRFAFCGGTTPCLWVTVRLQCCSPCVRQAISRASSME